MNRQTPPAPPGWNKTIQDLSDEAKKTGSPLGSPEVDWAKDYERSLIPAGTRFSKKGDVYEATEHMQVSYLTSWSAPFTGGGTGTLKKGERVIMEQDMILPRPVAVYAKPIDYAAAEERMVPASDRANIKYAGFYLCLRTVDLARNFSLVHEESTPALHIVATSAWTFNHGCRRESIMISMASYQWVKPWWYQPVTRQFLTS